MAHTLVEPYRGHRRPCAVARCPTQRQWYVDFFICFVYSSVGYSLLLFLKYSIL